MPDNISDRWVSAYLFYNEPWETFLQKSVLPFVKVTLQTGLSPRFFFIRYWDRGPHIRLRFKCKNDLIDSILRPSIREHFSSYFETKPSKRVDPHYPGDFPEAYKWYPNNSIIFIPYKPEINRYGGPAGMALAEKQFHLSSETVLKLLDKNAKDWSYETAIGTAIQLHLCFAHAMGMDMETCQLFFHQFFIKWLPSAFKYYYKNLSDKQFDHQLDETRLLFKAGFESQKETLIAYQTSIWETLEKKMLFEEELLNNWVTQNLEIGVEFHLAQQKGVLQERNPDFGNNSLKSSLLWEIFADMVHMTNNRLGIQNRDEGFVAYIIMKGMEAINPSSVK